MTSEELDRRIPVQGTNSREEHCILFRTDIDVTKDDDQVDVLIFEGFLELLFMHRVFDSVNHSVVCIACKIEDESKS